MRNGLIERLNAYNNNNKGNSTRIARVLILIDPANMDAGEITAKGNFNQRAILTNRAMLVEKLYNAGQDDIDVIILN